MTRAAAVLVPVFVAITVYAMDRVTWVAVRGVDPWPWVRAALGLALAVVAVHVIVEERRKDEGR